MFMNYLAVIKRFYDTESRSFKTTSAAEQWLDSVNANLEHLTYIDEYNDKWEKVGSYIYTQGKE